MHSLRIVTTILLLAACTPKHPEVYPQIQVSVDNLWADEGEHHRVVIGADGSFVRTHLWSNGSADFETVCRGQLPAALVDPWLSRVEAAATSTSSIELEMFEDGHESPHHRVSIGWAREQRGALAYADPRAWASELEAWIDGLERADGSCEPDRRRD